jgi:hypothetical protein
MLFDSFDVLTCLCVHVWYVRSAHSRPILDVRYCAIGAEGAGASTTHALATLSDDLLQVYHASSS